MDKNQFREALAEVHLADSIATAANLPLQQLDAKILSARLYTLLKKPRAILPLGPICLSLIRALQLQGTTRETDLRHAYAGALSDLEMFNAGKAQYDTIIAIKKKIYGDTTSQIGMQLSALGLMYFRKGQFREAINFGQQGLDMREGKTKPNPQLARAYLNFGIINKQAGLYEIALKYYGYVSQIIRENPQKYGRMSGDLYQSYAALYHDLGDLDKSVEYNELALAEHQRVQGNNSYQAASVLFNLGLLYADFRDWEKSRAYAKQAMATYLATEEMAPNEMADCYEMISTSYKASNLDSALYYAQRSFTIIDSMQAENKFYRASSMANLAIVYGLRREWQRSDSLMAIAIEDVKSIYGSNNTLTANYISERGRISTEAGQYEKALRLYAQEWQAHGYQIGCDLDKITNPLMLHESVFQQTQALIGLNRRKPDPELEKQIRRGWQEVLRLGDYLRRKYQGTGTKDELAAQFREITESALNWCLEKGDTAALNMAWKYAEKSRALALLEALQNTNAAHFAHVPDSLRQQERTLMAQMTNWELLRQDAKTNFAKDSLYQLWFTAKREQEALLQTIEKKYPKYYELKYQNEVSTLNAVRKLLLPNQALIEYFVGDSNIFIIVVSRNAIAPSKNLPYPSVFLKGGGAIVKVKKDFPLEAWISQFREGLYGYHSLPETEQTDFLLQKTTQQYVEFGQQLYNKLLAPLNNLLPLKWIVVPDGPLGYLPFTCLLSKSPDDVSNFKAYPYALKKYQISYAFSATLHQKMHRLTQNNSATASAIGLAPWSKPYLTPQASPGEKARNTYKWLKYSDKEVGYAQNKLGGDTLLGANATKTRFIEQAPKYRLIHLATHGFADNRAGDYSFLAFALEPGPPNKERLYLRDLYNMELNADLVVLSACETGIGRLHRGEGIISLARAFTYAGAKSLITTLWSINDQSSANLMNLFYQELKLKKPKDTALWFAQKQFLDDSTPSFCHPYYWAAFIPIGDMRQIK